MNEAERIILVWRLSEILTTNNASPYAKDRMPKGMSDYETRKFLAHHFLEEYRILLEERGDPTSAKRELAKRYNLTSYQKSQIKGMEGL